MQNTSNMHNMKTATNMQNIICRKLQIQPTKKMQTRYTAKYVKTYAE